MSYEDDTSPDETYAKKSHLDDTSRQESNQQQIRNINCSYVSLLAVIMTALCNRAGHYIFALWFLLLSIYLSFFFPCLISAIADWMSAILPHMAWLHANLRCRSETCYRRIAVNTGRKKVAKNRRLGVPLHNFVGLYLCN